MQQRRPACACRPAAPPVGRCSPAPAHGRRTGTSSASSAVRLVVSVRAEFDAADWRSASDKLRDLLLDIGRVGGDGQQRARRHIARQFAGDDRAAPVPAEDQRALRAERDRASAPRIACASKLRLRRVRMDRRVVLGDDDRLDALADDQVARRIEIDPALAVAQADQRAISRRPSRASPKVLPIERRLLGRVDFAAVEIEQLGIDGAEARLPARMHDDARDQIVGKHQLDFPPPTTRATSAFLVSRISAAMLVRRSRRRSGSLTSARIVLMTCESGSSPSGDSTMIERELCGLTMRQIVEVGRIAAAADDPGVAQRRAPWRRSRPPSRPCPCWP